MEAKLFKKGDLVQHKHLSYPDTPPRRGSYRARDVLGSGRPVLGLILRTSEQAAKGVVRVYWFPLSKQFHPIPQRTSVRNIECFREGNKDVF